ncbi:MAG: S8 family serine peptidase [Deltaproteobacteria bacterium]|nr:S8 family serine peptidase [Deltaproteobacteria bacterium]
MKMRNLWVVLSAITFSLSGQVQAWPGAARGEALVTLKKPLDTKHLEKLLERSRAWLVPFRGPAGVLRLHSHDGDTNGLLKRLSQDKDVLQASANAICRAASVENGDLYPYQWNLQAIGVEKAWELVGDGSGVVVGVLDTGVSYLDTDDEAYRVPPGLAGTDFVAPMDFVDGDREPLDENGHGTLVTSIIARDSRYSDSGAGISPGVSIMPVRVLDKDAVGTEADIVQGIIYAVEHGAQVINLSLTFDPGYTPSLALVKAVRQALDNGVVIVGAAGNDWGGPVLYPAALRGVIAVGAARLDSTGIVRAEYSASDARLDILAPGGDLDRDENNDGMADGIIGESFPPGMPGKPAPWMLSGTSASAAHVSASAALLLSAGAEPKSITARLDASASDLGEPGFDLETGNGLLNIGQAAQDMVSGKNIEIPGKRYVKIRVKTRRLHGEQGLFVRAGITVVNSRGRPVPGEKIFGRFIGKLYENVSCTTNYRGKCVIERTLPWDDQQDKPGRDQITAPDVVIGLVVDKTAKAAGLGTSPQGLVSFFNRLLLSWFQRIGFFFGLDIEPSLSSFNAYNSFGSFKAGGDGLGTSPVGFVFNISLSGFPTFNPYIDGAIGAGARDASVGTSPVQK